FDQRQTIRQPTAPASLRPNSYSPPAAGRKPHSNKSTAPPRKSTTQKRTHNQTRSPPAEPRRRAPVPGFAPRSPSQEGAAPRPTGSTRGAKAFSDRRTTKAEQSVNMHRSADRRIGTESSGARLSSPAARSP